MAANNQPGVVSRSNIFLLDPDAIDIDEGWNERDELKDIETLAAQIVEAKAVLQPITVWRAENGRFTVIDGERRVRAVWSINSLLTAPDGPEKRIEAIPAYIRRKDFPEDTALIEMFLANDGQEWTALERARIYRRLHLDHGWTQEKIALHVGRKQGHVSQMLSLLDADPKLQSAIAEGMITPTKAQAIIRTSHKSESPKAVQLSAVEEIESNANTPPALKLNRRYASMLLDEIHAAGGSAIITEHYRNATKYTPDQMRIFNMGRIAKLCELTLHKDENGRRGDLNDLEKILAAISEE